MIYLKVSPNKTIQYASASPEAGLVPYDGAVPDFPLLNDGSTAGWVGYRLVDGQLTFGQAVWDNWVQTNKSPEPVALLADDGAINADIRQIATSDTATLTLLNGWTIDGGGGAKAIKTGNWVGITITRCKILTAPTGRTIIAVMPVGMRPASGEAVLVGWSGDVINVNVNNNGEISVAQNIPVNNWTYICGGYCT